MLFSRASSSVISLFRGVKANEYLAQTWQEKWMKSMETSTYKSSPHHARPTVDLLCTVAVTEIHDSPTKVKNVTNQEIKSPLLLSHHQIYSRSFQKKNASSSGLKTQEVGIECSTYTQLIEWSNCILKHLHCILEYCVWVPAVLSSSTFWWYKPERRWVLVQVVGSSPPFGRLELNCHLSAWAWPKAWACFPVLGLAPSFSTLGVWFWHVAYLLEPQTLTI